MADAKDTYEDKYLELREENLALKRKKNEQEDTIKRMYTKLAIIEETLKRKEREAQPEAASPGVHTVLSDLLDRRVVKGSAHPKRDIDTEKFIDELRKENAALRRKTQLSTETTRQLKGQLTLLKAKHPGRKKQDERRPSPRHGCPPSPGHGNQAAALEGFAHLARDVHHRDKAARNPELEDALKARLVTAERRLLQLQRENDELRRGEGDNNDEHRAGSSLGKAEVEQLQRELRDRQAQLVILNARFDNLESKAAAEREIQEKTLEQMDSFNRVIHRLRAELQDAQLAKEALDKRAAKAKDLQDEVAVLQEQNAKLEERMTSLCESPFINDAFQRKERIEKLVELEKTNALQKKTIEALEAEAQKRVAAIQELQTTVRRTQQAKDDLDQEVLRLKRQLDEERHRQQFQRPPTAVVVEAPKLAEAPPAKLASPKPKAPSPVKVSVQTETFELPPPLSLPSHAEYYAMPVTARRMLEDATSKEHFSPLLTDRDSSVHVLKTKVHTLQIAHLSSTQELERCEKMLQAQTSINRELALEIEELVARKDVGAVALEKKLASLELVAEQRLKKIAQLEAQLRQLKYLHKHTHAPKPAATDDCGFASDDAPDSADAEPALLAGAEDLEPGENLLEVWVVSAHFEPKYVHGSSCTFVLCDFFDFESQTTALLPGGDPVYNFATSYKITADAFFLRYLASEQLTLEVHQALKGAFHVVGKAVVRLSPLLASRGVLRDTSVPVRHVESAAIMGTLSLVVRVALPVSETWQLHLQAHPGDQAFLSPPTTTANELADAVALGPMNDLEVAVVAGRQLFTPTGRPPSAYVHYQLLGFPDVFSAIAPDTATPAFDGSVHHFALCVDACLKQFLSTVRLTFTVFDDNVAGDDGVVGTADVSLAPLARGDAVSGWFELCDRRGAAAGELLLTVQWRQPFQVLAALGGTAPQPHELTLAEVHELLSTFALLQDGRVNYKAFLTYAHASAFTPAPFLETVAWFQSSLRQLLHDTPTMSAATLLGLDAPPQTLSKEAFVAACKARNLVVTPDQSCALTDVLGDVNGRLHASEVALHLEPTPPCHTRFLAHKLRDTVRQFERRERRPGALLQPFERYDPTGCHYVSRAEFKRGLKVLGFHIYDPLEAEAAAARESVVPSDPSPPPTAAAVGGDEEELRPVARTKARSAATAEFEQRKAAFAQRMKTAAAASQHSFVLDAPALPSLDVAARQIQRQFRRTRAPPPPEPPTTAMPPAPCSIIDVESFIAATADLPDELPAQWIAHCTRLDAAHSGGLAKKQMLHVLNQPPSALALPPAQVQRLVAYFTTPGSKRIAYAPLVHFVRSCRPPAPPPLLKLLHTLLLEDGDFAAFGAADPGNTGVLLYAEFSTCLREACAHLSAAQAKLVMQLFDVSGFGVDYRAFFLYVLALPHNVQLQKAKQRLRRLSPSVLQTLKLALAQARPGETFTKLQVATLWKQANVTDLSWPDQALLWQFLDKAQTGAVGVSAIWALFTPPAPTLRPAAFEILDVATLQHLARNSRRLLVPDAGSLLQAFARYDWRQLGVVGPVEFAAVVARAGFVLPAPAVASVLVPHFLAHGKVKYRAFVEWTHVGDVALADVERRLQGLAQERARAAGMPVSAVLAEWAGAFAPPVTRRSFAATLRDALALPLQPEELRVLLDALDPELTDTVDVARFVALEARAPPLPADVPLLVSVLTSVAAAQRDAVLRTFEAYDGRGTGVVEEEIFALCWRKLGVELSSNDVRALFDAHAKGHALPYRKFLKHVLQAPPPAPDAAATREHHQQLLAAALERAAATADPVTWREWAANLDVYAAHKGRPDVAPAKFGRVVAKTLPASDLVDIAALQPLLPALVQTATGRASVAALAALVRRVAPPEPSAPPEPAPAPARPSALQQSLSVLRQLVQNSVKTGVDYRAVFDKFDAGWAGTLPPRDVKAALAELGLHMVAGGPESVGPLVEHFRQGPDAVNYLRLLHEARPQCDPTWPLDESLRLRVRLKARLTVEAMAQDRAVYTELSPAFAHFDRTDEGFLTLDALARGLAALHYTTSAADVRGLFDNMSVFKTTVVSRVEFDAFVLDPHRGELLDKIAAQLWAPPPCFASVAQRLAAGDAGDGGLPVADFLEALRDHGVGLSPAETRRLLHLFDVNRQQRVSYKLFVRAMARLRPPEPPAADADAVTVIAQRIRACGRSGVAEVFASLDAVGSGVLPVGDVFVGLKHVGIELSPPQMRALVLAFPGGDRGVRYPALLTAVFSPATAATKGAPDASAPGAIVEQLRTFLQDAAAHGVRLVDCFAHFDTDDSGDVDAAELRQGLKRLEFPAVTDAVVEWVMATFGVDGKLDYQHFVRHLVGNDEPRSIDAVLQELRHALAAADVTAKELLHQFLHEDPGYSGHVPKEAFHTVFRNLGVQMGAADLRVLDDTFSPKNEPVAYRAFIAKMFAKQGSHS
ncbi:hypothetical protein ACHHYP_12456 [Achlya hypogyna]|uniref:Uncharacterized protein n=1 Tax=Achlya hypogyna TaxID=1202772 RepID=A0A1V9YGY3_ACHHY|nr:hypothetical protein ACHHYP_12456 [Achlya hypogyna]